MAMSEISIEHLKSVAKREFGIKLSIRDVTSIVRLVEERHGHTAFEGLSAAEAAKWVLEWYYDYDIDF
jgi:hypothetical protein